MEEVWAGKCLDGFGFEVFEFGTMVVINQTDGEVVFNDIYLNLDDAVEMARKIIEMSEE